MKFKNGCRLLCLDGGGVKGIVEAQTLMSMQYCVNKYFSSDTEGLEEDLLKFLKYSIDKPFLEQDHHLKMHTMFDAMCGTSTGALVATALSRMHMSPAKLIEEFIVVSRLIFPQHNFIIKWFNLLRSLVSDHERYDCKPFEDYLMDKSLSWSSDNADPKLGIVALRRDKGEKSGYKTFLFKSSEGDVKLWEAIRASTAAPTYLKAMTINKNLEFVDGALGSNCTVNEGMQLLGDTSASCLISIGCGIKDTENGGFKLGGIDVGRYAIDIIQDAQIKWEDFYNHPQNTKNFKSCCFRLNPDSSTKLGEYKLDKADKVKLILETYVNWLSNRKTSTYRNKIINASKLLFAKSFSILSVTVNGKSFSKSNTLDVDSPDIESVEVNVKFNANRSCSFGSTESWLKLVSDDAKQGGKKIKLEILFSGDFEANHILPLGAQGVINVKYDGIHIDGIIIIISFF